MKRWWFKNYDLQGQFDRFNLQIFDGQLPTPKFEWKDSSGWLGEFAAGTEEDFPGTIRLAKNFYSSDEDSWHRILVHEMVHLWEWATMAREPGHGSMFRRKCRELKKNHGIVVSRFPVDWNFVKVGNRPMTTLVFIGKTAGTVKWFGVDDCKIEKAGEILRNQWEEKGMVGFMLEIRGCPAADVLRRKRFPKEKDRYSRVPVNIEEYFSGGIIRIVKSMGISEKTIREIFSGRIGKITSRRNAVEVLAPDDK